MCRLRTGRLIHQGFQKQKRILFCYSGKTLATLSVWYTGGWFCYGPPVHGTWILKILENGSGQWVWLACVWRMSSCCLVLALPQKKAAHDCRVLCGWKDTDFVIKKHHSLLDGSVGEKCFLHQFSHLTCLLADLLWLFVRCKINPKVRSMAHKVFAVLGTPSPAVSKKPPLFTTCTLVAQW